MNKQMTRNEMEQLIRTYFDGCNEANIEKMMKCFAPDAVHYFPEGAPQGTFKGARAIAEGWVNAVENLGSIWTIDKMLIDEVAGEAVIEWTHFKTNLGGYLRGDEWYRFNQEGLITEIRAYYACPTSKVVHEIGDFDYKGRGYPLTAPNVGERV
jgi:ketosteroid isomerase-like protein